MIPLLYLRMAGAAAIVAVLTGGYFYIKHQGYVEGKAEVQIVLDAYKENINDQLSKAIIAKAKLEADQNAKFLAAKLDYSDARRNLDSILARLRDGAFVLRGETLPVAGNSPGGVSGETENPPRTIEPAEIEAGVRSSTFYALSMQDTLQCSRLIEFVK